MKRFVLVLLALSLVPASLAAAPRPVCQHVDGAGPWPQILVDGETVSLAEARRVVAAFRKSWRGQAMKKGGPVARATAPCMRGDRDYSVSRVAGAAAVARVPSGKLLSGQAEALAGEAWVWEVQFGGASSRLPPSGSFGGFLSADLKTIVIVHWPEG
jgi:hypothetical protein